MKILMPPKTWLVWFALVVGLIVASLAFNGCATTEAYVGPDYTSPIVQLETRPRWNTESDMRFPHWEMRRSLRFENPTKKPVSFDVDCDNSIFHVDVPARTIKRLLIFKEDGACNIKRVK